MTNERHSGGRDPHVYPKPANFIETEILEDLLGKRYERRLCTRFPPEPNGYWHIGHVYALMISATVAEKYGGVFNLRFDDTNPVNERQEFVDAALEDVAWLGVPVTGRILYASDYFAELYDFAVRLIERGHAYVCDLSLEELKARRGDYHRPGTPSPYRDRPVDENLDLFARMRKGEFAPRAKTLLAKIDMSSPNMNLRDPILYRIMDEPHYRQGRSWCIYPSYDFAQSFNDTIDGVTHSLCSIEFVNHRPLYDWLLEKAGVDHSPRQIEFAKLDFTGTVLGKRNIRALVEQAVLSGWDDPRLLTVRGMRRRGFPAEAVRDFCRQMGVSRTAGSVDASLIEQFVREHLNRTAVRRFAVFNPVRLVLENLPAGETITAAAPNNPEDPAAGNREVTVTRELLIEADDFMVSPSRKYQRLAPGREVRLRGAMLIKCTGYDTDPKTGTVTEVRATCDPQTLGSNPPDGRKVRGTIHWVSQHDGVDVTVRSFDRLSDDAGGINAASRSDASAIAEPGVRALKPGDTVQFERKGYYCVDKDSTPERLVLNRATDLKDTWKAIQGRERVNREPNAGG